MCASNLAATSRSIFFFWMKLIWTLYPLRKFQRCPSWSLNRMCSLLVFFVFPQIVRNVVVLTIFSSPEPKARVSYCHSASSVVRPSSSVRKLFTFSTSPLIPLNGIQQNLTWSKISTYFTKFVFFVPIRKTRWPPRPLIGWDIFDFSSESAEWNSTKLDRKQDLNVLYQVCVFRADRKNKMAARASGWLRHFRLLLWNCWMEYKETWQEARSQGPLPSLCFSCRSEKQDGRPGLWLAQTFSTSPLKLLNEIQRNLTESKISMSSTKFVFLAHPSRRLEWAIVIAHRPSSVRPSVVRPSVRQSVRRPSGVKFSHIFHFSSETAERNSTQLVRKQDLNALYKVCVFRVNWKNKIAALASDLLRHFQLLLWNGWTEFNETWQEARSQRPLPSLCFSSRSEKQNGRPGLWMAETFSTSPLKPLNRIQRNLTGSKISTPSTKFVFFGPIRKTKWPPWPLDWLRHFRLLLWNRWTEFNETWQEARSQRPLPSLCFSGRSEKQDGRPGLWLAETFSTSPLKPLNGIQRNLTGSNISTLSTKFVFFGLIGKTKWPPWPLIGRDILDFCSETAEPNSTKFDRKQDLKAL